MSGPPAAPGTLASSAAALSTTAATSSLSVLQLAMFVGILPLAFTAGYLYRAKYDKGSLMYLLYARTPLGRYLHQSELAKARLKQPQRPLVGFPPRPERPPAKQMEALTHETGRALVRIVPFLSDNYAYIVMCKATKECAVVDPADPETVFRAVAELQQDVGGGIRVRTVLTTHYHADHAGGNNEFVKLLKGVSETDVVEVVGGVNEKYPGIQGMTRGVKHGDTVQVGQLAIRCLDVPCHTWGSVMFLADQLLFTGDYLFSGGCGKFFEGGAQDFCTSLERSVNSLPDDVLIFPGHEYTLSNLKFAAKVLPDDTEIKNALDIVTATREAQAPTIPSSLGNERRINVFIRGGDPKLYSSQLVERVRQMVQERASLEATTGADKHDPSKRVIRLDGSRPDVVQVIRALRALKDRG